MDAAAKLARSFRAFVDGSGGTITGGWVHGLGVGGGSLLRVTVRRSQKDTLLNKSRPSLQSHVLDTASGTWSALPPTPLDAATLMVSGSPSGKFVCVVRKDTPATGADSSGAKAKTVLELWQADTGSLLRALHVEPSTHGDPQADSWFGAGGDGSMAWADDESAVAYVAEAPAPEASNFFDAAVAAPVAGDQAPTPPRGAQFDYALRGESWGERYESVRSPRLFIAHWGAGRVVAVPGVPAHLSAGQVVWAPVTAPSATAAAAVTAPVTAPSATAAAAAAATVPARPYALAFVGWSTTPRRLGMVYCYNRPCGIYALCVSAAMAACAAEAAAVHTGSAPPPAAAVPPPHAPPAAVLLTRGDTIARSPRFSPDGSALAYLSMSGSARYTHNGASALKMLPWGQWLATGALWAAAAAAAPACSAAAVAAADALAVTLVPVLSHPAAEAAAAGGGGSSGGDNDAAAAGCPPGFPSLYTHLLPASCWASDSTALYATSVWGFRQVVLRVEVPTVMPFAPGGSSSGAPWAHVHVESATDAISPLAEGDEGDEATAQLPRSASVLAVLPLPPTAAGASGASVLLVTSSSPTAPERFGIVISHSRGGGASRALPCPTPPPPASLVPGPQLRDTLRGLAWRVLRCRPLASAAAEQAEGGGEAAAASSAFEALLLWPQRQQQEAAAAGVGGGSPSLPLVVVPHGGPHSAFTADFSLPYAWLASTGYAVLLVNYRGSIGYGEAATASLPGRAGAADVADVHAAALTALLLAGARHIPGVDGGLRVETGGAAALPVALDPARVSVCGGSHGGFLAAHLVGQYPALYRAAAMRNPVTNIAGMVGASDIPDWCWTEVCGVPRSGGSGPDAWQEGPRAADPSAVPVPSAAVLARMHAASPLQYVGTGAVVAPTLLLLGTKDRRVPKEQGLEYWHALRAAGVPTRLLLYPEDNHALDKPATEADAWINIALWFGAHTGPSVAAA